MSAHVRAFMHAAQHTGRATPRGRPPPLSNRDRLSSAPGRSSSWWQTPRSACNSSSSASTAEMAAQQRRQLSRTIGGAVADAITPHRVSTTSAPKPGGREAASICGAGGREPARGGGSVAARTHNHSPPSMRLCRLARGRYLRSDGGAGAKRARGAAACRWAHRTCRAAAQNNSGSTVTAPSTAPVSPTPWTPAALCARTCSSAGTRPGAWNAW
jgi:hypothetical protein